MSFFSSLVSVKNGLWWQQKSPSSVIWKMIWIFLVSPRWGTGSWWRWYMIFLTWLWFTLWPFVFVTYEDFWVWRFFLKFMNLTLVICSNFMLLTGIWICLHWSENLKSKCFRLHNHNYLVNGNKAYWTWRTGTNAPSLVCNYSVTTITAQTFWKYCLFRWELRELVENVEFLIQLHKICILMRKRELHSQRAEIIRSYTKELEKKLLSSSSNAKS